ncbi:MAG: ATP-binding protein, partial [Fluviibacter sp.]
VISITISQDSAWGTISIQDSGSGIPQENIPKIFELYQSTKKDGLGVGLWLCKTIIDRHRGMISVKSSTHSGTCIEVQLPRLDDERRHQ